MYGTATHLGIFLKNNLPYDPILTLPGIYPREMKINVHTKTCLQLLKAALSVNSPKLETVKMSLSK